jgi:porphobilinogen synthase
MRHSSDSRFPATRMRRLRTHDFIRRLVQETRISVSDLICPMFILDGERQREPIASMPGVERLSIDLAIERARRLYELGIPGGGAVPGHTRCAQERRWPRSLQSRRHRAARHLAHEGRAARAWGDHRCRTRSVHHPRPRRRDERQGRPFSTMHRWTCWSRQALSQARAGVDIVAPSDMMDGRIGAIRMALEARASPQRLILAYAAKYAVGLLRPLPRRGGLGRQAAARATRKPTRWTRPMATKRCAKWRSTSPKAPTW